MPNGQPAQLANLRPQWQPGEQPKPGLKYVERMMERGFKISPQAISVIGRIVKEDMVHGELVPLHLRLRAAEYIVDKTWPKMPAGAQVTIEGASSLEVNFHFPGGDTKANVHATVTFDADGD